MAFPEDPWRRGGPPTTFQYGTPPAAQSPEVGATLDSIYSRQSTKEVHVAGASAGVGASTNVGYPTGTGMVGGVVTPRKLLEK